MTAESARIAPRAVVILLVVATVFNDLLPLLPLGELAKDGFIYVLPIGAFFILRHTGRLAVPVGFTWIFLAFLGAILVSVVVNYDEISTAYFKGRGGMSRVITQGMAVAIGPLVALIFYNFVRAGQMRDISRGAEVALWVMAGVGLLEIASWYAVPGLTQLFSGLSAVIHGEANDFYPIRMRMTAFEASWTAVMLTFVFPFAVTRAGPVRLAIYSGIVVLAVVLAQSRTAMLVIGVEFMMLLWALMRHRKDQIVYAATAVCVGLMVMFAIPGVQQSGVEKVSNLIEYGSADGLIDPSGGDENISNVTRLANMQAGVEMFKERPLFGVGFGQYGFHYPNYIRMDDMRSWEVRSYVTEADTKLAWPPVYSLHVRLLAEIGVLGYALWMAMFLPSLFRSLRMANGVTYLGRMHLAVAMTLTGWMLLGSSIDSFRFFGGWIALGVGLALPRPPRGEITSRSASAS